MNKNRTLVVRNAKLAKYFNADEVEKAIAEVPDEAMEFSFVDSDLVASVEEAMKRLDGSPENLPIAEMLKEYIEMMETFNLQWKADQRAVKLWQDAHNRPHTLPDRTNMVSWLMKELDATRTATRREAELAEWKRECEPLIEYLTGTPVLCGSPVDYAKELQADLAAARAEVERLTQVLTDIRDSDETNAIRLQNKAM